MLTYLKPTHKDDQNIEKKTLKNQQDISSRSHCHRQSQIRHITNYTQLAAHRLLLSSIAHSCSLTTYQFQPVAALGTELQFGI